MAPLVVSNDIGAGERLLAHAGSFSRMRSLGDFGFDGRKERGDVLGGLNR